MLEWGVEKSPEEIMTKRNAMIAQIEQANNTMRKSHGCEEWFKGCDPLVRKVTKNVNGALFQQLLVATDYHDVDCVNMFRRGAKMVGPLHRSGVGRPTQGNAMSEWQAVNDPDKLKGNIESSNKRLKRTLKEDQHHEKLLGLVKTDWGLDRMTEPVIGGSELLSGVLVHPRFAVEQTKTDGSLKYRAVDNLSWAAEPVNAAKDAGRSHKFATKLNSVNGHVFPTEKMKHESIDMMVDLLKTHVKKHKKAPHLWKADIDAAFRRVSLHSAPELYIIHAYLLFLADTNSARGQVGMRSCLRVEREDSDVATYNSPVWFSGKCARMGKNRRRFGTLSAPFDQTPSAALCR